MITGREYLAAQINADREMSRLLDRATEPFGPRADAFEKLLKRYDRMERALREVEAEGMMGDLSLARLAKEALADD